MHRTNERNCQVTAHDSLGLLSKSFFGKLWTAFLEQSAFVWMQILFQPTDIKQDVLSLDLEETNKYILSYIWPHLIIFSHKWRPWWDQILTKICSKIMARSVWHLMPWNLYIFFCFTYQSVEQTHSMETLYKEERTKSLETKIKIKY